MRRMNFKLNRWLLWRSSRRRCFSSGLKRCLSFRKLMNLSPYSANRSALMNPLSLQRTKYPDGAASCHASLTLPALRMIIGGTCRPPALMNDAKVVVVPFSSATVWKARSPTTPMTLLSFGTSLIPVSSTFHILFGLYSICYCLTHCFKSRKNFSTCTGLAAIACPADRFCAFFFRNFACVS